MTGNFTEVKPLRYWVQHILPLVYDDSLSYMELLGKVISTLNEIVKNNNLLPDYITKLIKEYISSGEIEKVLAEVLANYMLNVKFPPAGLQPATGNGSADDTEAIQGCIDYAYNNGGMSVYFPSGSYLTQPLTLRDKATLFGQDRYTTHLVMKGGATKAMFTGDVDELTLTGLGFDGNMDIQVNNVNLFTISVNSAIITNCLLTDGYDLLNITVNGDLQLNDVIFKHAVENALVLKGAGIVQGNNLVFKSVSALVGKNFVVMDVSKSILEQLKCYGASPNAVLINGSNNVVKMWNEQSLKAYTDNGTNNTVEVYTQSEQKKLTGFKTTDVSGDLTETVGGNKTESITGNKGVSVQDLTETVAGNHNKTVTGNISESANNFKTVIHLAYELTANRLTERLTNKEVNAANSVENLGNKTETITGDKHVNAANSVETVQSDKTITAGDIYETTANKTAHITQDMTEQIDGDKNITSGNMTYDVKNKYDLTTKEFKLNADNAIVNLKEHLFNVIFDDKKINLYNTLYDFVNIKDYGAVGDGVSDDTRAFKSAMNAGNVFIPSGRYIITELSGTRTVLSNGEIVSDLTLTEFDNELIGGKYKSLNILNCNCKLTNLNVDNTSNALTATNSKIVLADSYFKGGGNCVLLTNCVNSIIENIFVEAVKITDEETRLHCVQLESCTNCKITNSFALNANWFGFSVYNSFKCAINNCISYNSYAEGINFENTNSSIMSDNILSWDDGISNDYGISLFGNNDNSANLNIVSGNLIYNCKQSGIAVDGNAHSNNVYGNNLINCNSQNTIRNAAITSGKLEGYTGQPGNNYIHDNLVMPSSNTTGLYNEIETLSKNYINNNFSTIPLNIGNYGMSVVGSNIGIDTIAFNSTSNNGEITESFIVGITPVVFMVSATLNVTETKETQISIPYNTNSLVFGCAFDILHTVTIQVFGHDNVISFTPTNSGIHYIRAIVSLYNR